MRVYVLIFAAVSLLHPKGVHAFCGNRIQRSPLSTNLNCRIRQPTHIVKESSIVNSGASRFSFNLGGGGSLDGDVDGKNSSVINFKKVMPIVGLIALVGAVGGHVGGLDLSALIESSVSKIAAMGPYGYIYFALVS